MKIRKLFKRRSPYSPVAFLGRKTTERILGGHIAKLSKTQKSDDKHQDDSPCHMDAYTDN